MSRERSEYSQPGFHLLGASFLRLTSLVPFSLSWGSRASHSIEVSQLRIIKINKNTFCLKISLKCYRAYLVYKFGFGSLLKRLLSYS